MSLITKANVDITNVSQSPQITMSNIQTDLFRIPNYHGTYLHNIKIQNYHGTYLHNIKIQNYHGTYLHNIKIWDKHRLVIFTFHANLFCFKIFLTISFKFNEYINLVYCLFAQF
jgi:hypothetical protein